MKHFRLLVALLTTAILTSALTSLERTSIRPSTMQPAQSQSHLINSITPSDHVIPTDTVNGLAVGRTAGGGSVTEDGAAQYIMPLWVPPGRADIQPDLSLVYKSRGGNSLVGMGWMLSGLPRITRCARTFGQDGGAGAIQFVEGDQGDRFCLDGERLIAVGGSNGTASVYGADGTEYRTEHDRHVKVVSYSGDALGPGYFKVYLKDGRILTLGGGGSSNSWLQGQRAHVSYSNIGPTPDSHTWPVDYKQEVRHAWVLSRMEDRAGNYLTAQYNLTILPNFGYEQLPVSITYTASASDSSIAATRSIQFSYEGRPDPDVHYVSGFRIEQRSRLIRIDMRWRPDSASSELLRSYLLKYRNDGATKRSLLHQVQECDGAGACLPPTKFDWSPGPSSDYADTDTKIAVALTSVGSTVDKNPVLHVGDLDADGRGDIRYRDNSLGGGSTSNCNRPASSGSIGCRNLPLNCVEFGEGPEVQPDGRLIDVNGDSRDDLIYLQRDACDNDPNNPVNFVNRTVLNLSGSGSVLNDTVEQFLPYTKPSYELDMNGDGLPESVHADYAAYRLNTNGRLGDFLDSGVYPSFSANVKGLAVDVDGSGRASLLVPEATYSALSLDSGVPVVKPQTVLVDRPGYSRPIFMDVNGDGLSDWVSEGLTRGFLHVSVNTGNGWAAPEHWAIPAPFSSSPSVDPLYTSPNANTYNPNTDVGARVLDYNGDGRQDLLLMAGAGHPTEPLSTLAVLLSTGTGFEPVSLPKSIPIGANVNLPGNLPGSYRGWKMSQVLDSNGDGLDDFIQVVNGTFHVYSRLGSKGDLLTGITNGLGAKESFEYGSVADASVYTPGTGCTYPQTCAVRGVWVVLRHQISAPDTPTHSSLRYEYQDSRSDLTGRGWLGFGHRSETDEVSGRVTNLTFDNQTRVSGFYPCQGISRLETTDVPLLGGGIWRRTVSTTCRVVTENNDRVYFAYPASREMSESEGSAAGGPTLLRRSHMSETQDNYGNVTAAEKLTYAVRNGEPTGRPHKLQVTAEFDNFEASWLIGQKMRQQETSTTRSGQTSTRTTEYDYEPDTGLLAMTRVEPEDRNRPEGTGSGFFLDTNFRRTQYGLVSTITRAGSGQTRVQQLDYDGTDHAFLKSVRNPAGSTAHLAYHQGLGVLASVTDPNGLQSLFQYDGFGRTRYADAPDESDITTHYVADSNGQPKVANRVNGGISTDIYLDFYGREAIREWQTFSGDLVRSEKTYDEVGRLASVAYPHAIGDAVSLESFQYDNLSRLVSSVNPDGTSQNRTYQGLQTIDYDEKGNQNVFVEDELGRLASSADLIDGRTVRTSFEYGPFSLLETMTGPEGVTTSMTYDRLGRRTTLTDPDSGPHVTHYDAFGDLKDESDANANRTTYDRDVLGRPRTITTKDGITSLVWDTAAHGIGKLAESRSPDGVQMIYRYDPLSRLGEMSSTMAGAPLSLGFTYTAFGRPDVITYPDVPGHLRLKVKYTYTPRGDLQSVEDQGTHRAYWVAQARNALREPTVDVLGNGVTTTRRYDDRGRLRFIDSKSPGSTNPLQALEYQYEDNSNLARRYDHAAHLVEEFSYDSVDRLGEWTIAQGRAKKIATAYAYSDGGNILSQMVDSGAGMAYTYGEHGAGPHAVTKTTSGNKTSMYTYDLAGNQTTAPGRTVSYTSFGLPSRIKTATGNSQFKYDAFHNRTLKQEANGNSTIYLGGLYEKRTVAGRAVHVFYIASDEGPVAQAIWSKAATGFAPDRTLYLHDDALGSTETVSNANAQAVGHFKYSPFGSGRSYQNMAIPSGPLTDVRLGFTGHEHDDELGLINTGGRIFDPKTGRFLSPDSWINTVGGQALNSYSYALNNPLAYTDPSGFQPEGPLGGDWTFSDEEGGHITVHPPRSSALDGPIVSDPPIGGPTEPGSGASCPGICGGGSDNPGIGSNPHVADDSGSRQLVKPESVVRVSGQKTQPRVLNNARGGYVTAKDRGLDESFDEMTASQLEDLINNEPGLAREVFGRGIGIIPKDVPSKDAEDWAGYYKMVWQMFGVASMSNAPSLSGLTVSPPAPNPGVGPRTFSTYKTTFNEIEPGAQWIVVEGPQGKLEFVMSDIRFEGELLVLEGVHIQGAGAGKVGIVTMRNSIQAIGREYGAREVLVIPQTRTSGARPGHVFPNLRIPVK